MTKSEGDPKSEGALGTVWITGAGGLIGNCLVKEAKAWFSRWNARGLTRQELDLTDYREVRRQFERDKPALVVHCAALTDTTQCQANPELAWRLNFEMTARLAEIACDIPLIYFSTDLVFDGRVGNYSETAMVNPLSVYAETKAAAEKLVLANPRHSVVRTSLNGGVSPTGDRGFNEKLRRAWETGQMLDLYVDEFRCPIAGVETARAVWQLAAAPQPGLFHVAGSERMSRWDIGQALARRWPQVKPRLRPASLQGYRGAPRSPDTSLNCAKVQRLLSFPLPGLTEWLARHPEEEF
ncbi:dTDP-4-dehydrorhamnose reductase [Verrucomicrobia bacterium]|nr:dTDP-4-dehydrorhamnose reductase [Verrucomicrobiota bacterium]